jgi:hypothetical protein
MSLEQSRRRHFIEGLRAVANFYEQNADAYYDGMHITLKYVCMGWRGTAHAVRDGPGFGQCNKHYGDHNVTVSRQFSEQITLAVFAPRAKVCRGNRPL